MDALFIYFGKMILTSAVMFAYYHLVLKDKTFHHYNRFYLLSIVAVSLLLPLLKVSYFTLEVNSDIYLLLNKIQNFDSTKTLNDDFFYFNLITLIVGLVSIVLLTRLFIGLLKISKFKEQFKKEKIEGISFYQTDLENAPFSFFRNLFWKNTILLNSDLGRQILKHEMVHIEQKHSVDKMVMELVTGLLWFNPVFWFIRKEINLIHEYLADKKAVNYMDTKAFAQMLLASHFSGNVIPATSPFLNSNLKKRLKMLQKPNTEFGYMRRILALPLVFAIAFIYLVNAKNKQIIETNNVIEDALIELQKDTIRKTETAAKIDKAAKSANTEPAKMLVEAKMDTVETKATTKESETLVDLKMKEAVEAAKELNKTHDNWKVENKFENEGLKWNIKIEKNTPADVSKAKERAKLAAEGTELTKKQAEQMRKEAKLRKQNHEYQNKSLIVGVESYATSADGKVHFRGSATFVPEGAAKGTAATSETVSIEAVLIETPDGKNVTHYFDNLDQKELKYYIDDKEVSKADLDRLSPKDIKSIHVTKPGPTSEKKNNQIKVYTKD